MMKTNERDPSHLTVQKSAHNANMVVQKSILGENAVHTHVLSSMKRTFCDGGEGQGQRILCLDGGGIKVSRIRTSLQSSSVVGSTYGSPHYRV